MANLYHILLYQPLLNALIFFYQTIAFKDLGLAIIFLTVLIRIILFPIFSKSVRHQMLMQELQPKIKKIQDEHKHNRQRQGEAMMGLYREHRINPFSGIFLLFVQLPILIALFQIFNNILRPDGLGGIYSFLIAPDRLNTHFLGFNLIPLEESNIIVAGFAALAQYVQSRLALPKIEKGKNLSQAEKMGRQMAYIAPVITFAVLFRLPAAIGLYWLTTSLFSIIQQKLINRSTHNGQLGNVHK